MIEIRCTIPPGFEEAAALPLRFLQTRTADDPNLAAAAATAAAHCAKLRTRHPDVPFVHHLSACISWAINNHTAAMALCSEALAIDHGYADSRVLLDGLLAAFGEPGDAALFGERRGRGLVALSEAFFVRGRALLEAGQGVDADHQFQRGIAIRNPQVSQLMDYGTCRGLARKAWAAGTLDQAVAERAAHFDRMWATADEAAAVSGDAGFRSLPHRRQLARLVADELAAADGAPATCFELGCYTGVNLELVREELAKRADA